MKAVLIALSLALLTVPAPGPAQEVASVSFYGEEFPLEEDTLIYVIDISGSMSWGTHSHVDGPPRSRVGSDLDRAKMELMESLESLPHWFEFNVIAFNCDVHAWMPQPQPATPDNKVAAMDWFVEFEPRGGSATGPAIAQALQNADTENVILLSDGAPNCGASGAAGHLNMIVGANTQGAKVHTFGIHAYGSFVGFLQKIASATGGNYYPVN